MSFAKVAKAALAVIALGAVGFGVYSCSGQINGLLNAILPEPDISLPDLPWLGDDSPGSAAEDSSEASDMGGAETPAEETRPSFSAQHGGTFVDLREASYTNLGSGAHMCEPGRFEAGGYSFYSNNCCDFSETLDGIPFGWQYSAPSEAGAYDDGVFKIVPVGSSVARAYLVSEDSFSALGEDVYAEAWVYCDNDDAGAFYLISSLNGSDWDEVAKLSPAGDTKGSFFRVVGRVPTLSDAIVSSFRLGIAVASANLRSMTYALSFEVWADA